MGDTKKRRNTKHRGNAAGMVETRGRTNSRTGGSAAPQSGKGRGPRPPQPATWNRAALKGGIPLLFLLILFGFTGKTKSVGGLIGLAVVGVIVYIPAVYYMDRFMYNRYLKRGR